MAGGERFEVQSRLMDEPHHDSGYFEGMTNSTAWVFLMIVVVVFIGLIYAALYAGWMAVKRLVS